MLLGLNIGKNAATPIERAVDDYLVCLDGVYPHADYVTINISSPNTANLRSLQSDEALDALAGRAGGKREALAARAGRRVPLFVKIAPDLDEAQVERHRRRAAAPRHGRRRSRPTPPWRAKRSQGLPHAEETGGLSGAPVREASNRVIAQLRAALGPDFPIIGVGGVIERGRCQGQDRGRRRSGADLHRPDLPRPRAGARSGAGAARAQSPEHADLSACARAMGAIDGRPAQQAGSARTRPRRLPRRRRRQPDAPARCAGQRHSPFRSPVERWALRPSLAAPAISIVSTRLRCVAMRASKFVPRDGLRSAHASRPRRRRA